MNAITLTIVTIFSYFLLYMIHKRPLWTQSSERTKTVKNCL